MEEQTVERTASHAEPQLQRATPPDSLAAQQVPAGDAHVHVPGHESVSDPASDVAEPGVAAAGFVAPSSYLRPSRAPSRPVTRDSRPMHPLDKEQIEGLVSVPHAPSRMKEFQIVRG